MEHSIQVRSLSTRPLPPEGEKLRQLVKCLLWEIRDGKSEFFGKDKTNPNVFHRIGFDGKYERMDMTGKVAFTYHRKTHVNGKLTTIEPLSTSVTRPKAGHQRKCAKQVERAPRKEGPRLITLDDVVAIVGFKKSFIHKHIELHQFPKPKKFGVSRRAASRWLESEIHDWVEQQMLDRPTYATPN